MWSGGTGSSGNNSQWSHNQWSFNASSYAHLPADQVDWAALAQQWIQMKDTQQHHQPIAQFPDPGHQFLLNAPQFPQIPASNAGFRVDNNVVPQPVDPWTTAIQEQQHMVADVPVRKEEWTAPSDSFPPTDFTFQQGSYGHHEQQQAPHHHHHPQTEEYGEYWNGPHMSGAGKKLHHPKREYSNHPQHDVTRTTQELDAIRRKSLPAWIREGLEKVEREKRKKQEKEEQDALKAQMLEAQKSRLDIESLENHTSTKWANPPEGNDIVDDDKIEVEKVPKIASPSETLKDRLQNFLAELNKEENFDQLMLCVRRQLTSILLDGTNDVMMRLANEMLEKYKRKASQVKKIKAVASLKSELGGFGLTSYGGSDSEEESAIDSGSNSSSDETEEEISMEIEKRKKNFQYIQNLRFLGSEPKSPESPERRRVENSDGTAGDSSKVQEQDASTSPSGKESPEGKEAIAEDRPSQPLAEPKKEKVTKNASRSLSPSSHERSRSRSVSVEKTKRSRKSRSQSREKRRSKRSRTSSRDRKKSKKSRSRSKSRERKRSKRSRSKSRERKRYKKTKSRSRSREKRRHKRSRSRSTDKKKSRKSHSRSKSRERERRNHKRSSSPETRKRSKRSRSTSHSRKRSSKKSRSKSRERRTSKRSRPESGSRDLSSRVSRSRSNSSDGWESKRSSSKDRKKSNKKSDTRRSKSHDRKSSNSSKPRESKKRKKSRSRSESSDRASKFD